MEIIAWVLIVAFTQTPSGMGVANLERYGEKAMCERAREIIKAENPHVRTFCIPVLEHVQ